MAVAGLTIDTGPRIDGWTAEVDAGAAFERLKTLQGRWEGAEKDDANHFTTVWEFFRDGKKTMSELETFTRTGK